MLHGRSKGCRRTSLNCICIVSYTVAAREFPFACDNFSVVGPTGGFPLKTVAYPRPSWSTIDQHRTAKGLTMANAPLKGLQLTRDQATETINRLSRALEMHTDASNFFLTDTGVWVLTGSLKKEPAEQSKFEAPDDLSELGND